MAWVCLMSRSNCVRGWGLLGGGVGVREGACFTGAMFVDREDTKLRKAGRNEGREGRTNGNTKDTLRFSAEITP